MAFLVDQRRERDKKITKHSSQKTGFVTLNWNFKSSSIYGFTFNKRLAISILSFQKYEITIA